MKPRIDPFQKREVNYELLASANPKEVFESLENLFTKNSEMAAKAFADNMHLLNAEQLAKCATMFAGKALEMRMAREKGFKDQPVNTQILIQLQKTLDKVTPAKVIDIP